VECRNSENIRICGTEALWKRQHGEPKNKPLSSREKNKKIKKDGRRAAREVECEERGMEEAVTKGA
jgi:hypothetical protein